MHYGTKEHSGRYPWGSGENPYQRLGRGSMSARIRELEEQGITAEKEQAKALGISTTALRQALTLERNEAINQRYYRVRELHEKGWSNVAIGKELGVSEGTVRNYLKADYKEKVTQLRSIADQLEKELKTKKYLDVGEGAQYALNCTETRMQAAIALLQSEGYEYKTIKIDQLGTNHKTTVALLCPPGTETKDIYNHLDDIHEIDESRLITVNGEVKLGMQKPRSVSRDRIMVRYGDEGGSDKDGVIELRRGVDDISLGKANYAQVRIAVDDKAYMKGMAIYNDNMPDGVDIIYNTNRKRGTPDYDGSDPVFKKLKINDDNPFGATILGVNDPSELRLTQREYVDKNGKVQQSCINVVNEEGKWGTWSKTLSSQFLSKQTVPLAKRQLDLAYKQNVSELDDILNLTEPTVKKKMLMDFADECDAAASELKAASLPRQRTHVILPVPSLADNEIYAPNYKNGEHVVLIRHPHEGVFQIPELVVNNNHKEGKSIVGNAVDAVGINIKTAEKLSGADFDGDTVIVIPSDNVHIRTSPTPAGLKDFDTKKYKLPDDIRINPKTGKEEYVYPTIKSNTKQNEMGKISNLITDMTLFGADQDEIVRATRHSMVVIDSEKHRLDYKQSERDNNISELKKKYQGGANKGAATIVSRASAVARIPEQKDYYKIDPKTGEKLTVNSGKVIFDEKGEPKKDAHGNILHEVRTYKEVKKVKDPETGKVIGWEETGKVKEAQSKTTRMATTKDAYTLTSDGKGGHPMETAYADYANEMKKLANRARKEYLAVEDRKYNPSAAETYASEVQSIKNKLLIAQKNAPRERQAQIIANSSVKAQMAANPEIKEDKDRMKKIRGQALSSARARAGAKAEKIYFTDKEWEAIQSGALRKTTLEKVITKADKDEVRNRSMPKSDFKLPQSKINLIKAYAKSGQNQQDIAEMLGISVSTVSKVLNG